MGLEKFGERSKGYDKNGWGSDQCALSRLIVFTIAALTFGCIVGGQAQADTEISLYDSQGRPVAYVDVEDDLTVYLWGGKPVAYLDGDDVYGFNGMHLGWFDAGAIVDHDGYVPCVVEERYPGSVKYEPYKGYKKYKPYKSFKQFAPFRPFEHDRFSSTPCALFLARGG